MAVSLSAQVVNQALQLIGGNQPLVTGTSPTFDDSTSGRAAQQVYVPCVATIARQFEWDFTRNTQVLVKTGNTPLFPWPFEYIYPANAVDIWQISPQSLADPNDPLPINWDIGNNLVNGVQTRVILTDLDNAQATYNNNPAENTWDAGFREAVVRLLASELAMAIAGKPDTAEGLLTTSAQFAKLGEMRQG